MNDAYLLIGGNVGDRLSNLQLAISKISDNVGQITKISSIYETAAWGKTDQDAFLNQVLMIQTNLSPLDLLKSILNIELEMGRIRNEKYAARTIDIDILYFNDLVIDSNDLIIPHPRISERKFVLVPIHEIAASMIDKRTEKTIHEMLETCMDTLPVLKYPLDVDNITL
jgi:2-amino-4-hydroxy-6-hydroxymethyldihydropteridine diphosphokinase